MKTYVTEYNLHRPFTPVKNLEGYSTALILVRRGRQSLGLLKLELSAVQPCLKETKIREAISQQIGDLPSEEVRPEIPRPPVSVVVCTRDRAEIIGRCLESLKNLDYPKYEVIVVDNVPNNDRVKQVVASTPFRYVREDRPGLDWARNKGLAEARYDLIAYTDDDAVLDPAWLLGLTDGLADPQVMGVTGLILPAELETEAQVRFETNGFNKGLHPRQFDGRQLSPKELIEMHVFGAGANMIFRRRVFEQIGDFDTALSAGTPARALGDHDLWHRAMIAGMTWRYEPRALAWHYHRDNWGSLQKQLFNYGCGFGVYLLKIGRAGQLPRREVVHHAFIEWLWPWFLKRMFQRHNPQDNFPYPRWLIWVEFLGALRSPWAYIETYWNDRRIRRRSPAESRYDRLKFEATSKKR